LANKFEAVVTNSQDVSHIKESQNNPNVKTLSPNKRKPTESVPLHEATDISNSSKSSEDDQFEGETDSETDDDDVNSFVNDTNSPTPQGTCLHFSLLHTLLQLF
jgi:hypothetical protein